MKYHQSDSKTYGINKLALIPSFTVRDVQYWKFFNGYHRERAFGTFWFIVGSSSEAITRIIKFILNKRLMNPHCWHITHGLYSTHFVGHVLSRKIICHNQKSPFNRNKQGICRRMVQNIEIHLRRWSNDISHIYIRHVQHKPENWRQLWNVSV